MSEWISVKDRLPEADTPVLVTYLGYMDKFDRWYDMVWMEKIIGEPHAGQPAVKPYSEVKE